jgi:hypothetical protein
MNGSKKRKRSSEKDDNKKLAKGIFMPGTEEIKSPYGIDYKHEVIPGKNNKFTRSDIKHCFIEYYTTRHNTTDTSPFSIYIQSFECPTYLKGSGRVLMMELFYFLKKYYKSDFNDDTYVLLSPYPSSDENHITLKDNYSKLVAYYESLNFEKITINGINMWGGKIGDILNGIIYRKEGGKGKKSRKCKKGKKSRSYKRK